MPSRRRKRRRRTVPRNIGDRTDREIMEIVLGKRVMRQVDRLLEDGGKRGESSIQQR